MVDRNIPKYVSEQINAPIELGYRKAEISSNGKTISGRGCARLHLGPRERVVITVEVEEYFEAVKISYSKADLMLKLEGANNSTAVISTQTRATNEKCELKLLARSGTFELCRDRRIRLKSAILHLVNFPAFVCLCENSPDFNFEDGNRLRRLGRVVLTHEEWRIEIQELPHAQEIVKQLKSAGGSGITHVAKVDRRDGKSFSISALRRVIGDLHHFLSFARGQWTSIFGPVGYDARDAIVYESWGTLLSAPWQSGYAWLDVHHGEHLAEAYTGFVTMLHAKQLREAVSSALYWYLRSNRGGDGAGIDSGLILSQAALERLSVAVLSSSGSTIPKTAGDKIRAACLELKIPIALPRHLKELQKAKRADGNLSDAINMIVGVRNELVHPKRRMVVKIAPLIVPCWQLAQWYIEMFLLKLSGYNGRYSNRLKAQWVGEVEIVPWGNERKSSRKTAK
ncbi:MULTISPECIES: hypothetical protein [unclassified Ensifer]|uniref:hypothetical protein n=1 Tax=unclassified Ensifer TaxID=2633371 RepID=UPI0008130945|nr:MULTISPECIES: hypothetical protein [unclassified Ensifer]OCP17575.1 hypothetical protein BC361_09030 [Ensifer sp. LC54]OCP28518.1 hypothetical protein BC363_01330 [Ensifer sp. LC384]